MYVSKSPIRSWTPWFAAALLALAVTARAQPVISEILFNPPGPDAPNEYIELRGSPNQVLSNGTYFVAVEGDTNGNPGTIQNVFDLSGRTISGNGFLVLLQNSNSYAPHSNAVVLANTNGPGFGSGSSSIVRHRGEGGQTDIENNSVTFFLIQSTNFPTVGVDIDADNDGMPDGALYLGWTIFDSVAVLDGDGFGDIGYGKINFRRGTAPGNGATVANGTIVSVAFTPVYVARAGNTTNWVAASWVASGGLGGSAPNWSLDNAETEPPAYAGRALNHIGTANFGATSIPGVVARESNGSTVLTEGSVDTDSYSLVLNTAPTGNVTITIAAGDQLRISTDGGANFATVRTLVFSNTAPVTVLVRALEDNVVDTQPHVVPIVHTIAATADPVRYPTGSVMPVVNVSVSENDTVLLSELKVNPPGVEDVPYEFIELRGNSNVTLTNIYFLAVEGDEHLNPGMVNTVINLTGERLGSSGLLFIAADGHPYTVAAGARVFLAPELGIPGGGLGNGSMSFLLVSSPAPIVQGTDLDAGNNGTLEGFPPGTTVLDSVAWRKSSDDVIYSPALLTQDSGIPDAATRFPGNMNANFAGAWINGNLEGTAGDSLIYDGHSSSSNMPYGTHLTPGGLNNTAPKITGLHPFSSVIGDPTTPSLQFQVSDTETPVNLLTVSVTSSDESIVPATNLVLTGTGSQRTLSINPIGVGYAIITVSAGDGDMTGLAPIQYAASADLLGGGRFHTGVSDGSTALAIDSSYMLVGDDENQVLRIYSRSNSGPAIVEFDMNPFLGLLDFYPNGLPREVDLEGSTRVGNRLYWIGSHSHSQDSEVRTNRGRIFCTDLAGTGTNVTLNYVGRYDYLKLDLMNWDANNLHGKGADYYGLSASGAPGVDPKAPDGSGFNIEGLSMAPGSTNVAYVCFRAPLVPATNRAKALLVPVVNFTALAAGNITNFGAAQFGEPVELNLGGRGVRSIEGNSNGYLIVAGPPAAVATEMPPSDFRFFTWTGLATNVPQEHGTILNGLIPEGIVELPPAPWTSNSTVQLVTDNGITVFYDDAVPAKLLPVKEFKKTRSDWKRLGSVVVSQPAFKSVQNVGNSCLLTWYSVAGLTYRVQSKSMLSDPHWLDVPGDVVATDALAAKNIAMGGSTQRFFRVIIP